jgi:acyl carrier protein
MPNDTLERLMTFICGNFMVQRDEFELDQSLVDQGVIDSFGLVEISSYLQKEFGITVDDTELNRANFGSVLKIVDFIERKKRS